jgi:hypothetical protein
MYKPVVVILMLLCFVSWSTVVISAEPQPYEFDCPHDEPWTPTQEELEKILADHLVWLDSSVRDAGDVRRANLCNARLLSSPLG